MGRGEAFSLAHFLGFLTVKQGYYHLSSLFLPPSSFQSQGGRVALCLVNVEKSLVTYPCVVACPNLVLPRWGADSKSAQFWVQDQKGHYSNKPKALNSTSGKGSCFLFFVSLMSHIYSLFYLLVCLEPR